MLLISFRVDSQHLGPYHHTMAKLQKAREAWNKLKAISDIQKVGGGQLYLLLEKMAHDKINNKPIPKEEWDQLDKLYKKLYAELDKNNLTIGSKAEVEVGLDIVKKALVKHGWEDVVIPTGTKDNVSSAHFPKPGEQDKVKQANKNWGTKGSK